jgi:SAM-dependent methyltransferase
MDDPVERHRAQAPEVLRSGDPDAIKRLYVDLGAYFYEAHGGDPDGVPVLSAPETAPAVAALTQDVGGRFLDAGCGPIPVASLSLGSRPDRHIVALDLGLGTVRIARAMAARAGVPVAAVVGDVEALPFRSDAFDGIVCGDTVEHLPHDEAGVKELARVLSCHGRMVLATPNRRSLPVVLAKLRDRVRGRRMPDDAYFVSNSHVREYTWPEFERLVRPRFNIRRRAPVGWDGGLKRRAASRLVRLPGLHRLSQTIVVEVERLPSSAAAHSRERPA